MGIDPSVMAISRGKIMMNHGNYGYSTISQPNLLRGISSNVQEGIFHQQTRGGTHDCYAGLCYQVESGLWWITTMGLHMKQPIEEMTYDNSLGRRLI